jgi:type II secretory pathway component PulF
MARAYVNEAGGSLISIREATTARYKNSTLRVKLGGLLMALEAIALLVSTGITIDKAMRVSANRVPPGKLRHLFSTITQKIEENGNIPEAFAIFPNVFPGRIISLLRAYVDGGALDKGLYEICDYFTQMVDIRANIKQGLMIPVISLVGGLVTGSIIFGFTIPNFKKFVAAMMPWDKLPWISKFFFGISDIVVNHPFLLLSIIIGIPLAGFGLFRIRSIKTFIYRHAFHLPILGSAMRASALARFCATFSILAENGIRPVPSIEMSASAAGEENIVSSTAMRISAAVQNAKYNSIGEAFEKEDEGDKAFPYEFKTAIIMGEDKLPEIFKKMTAFHTKDAKRKTEQAVQMMTPASAICIGGFALLAVFSIMLPIVSIIRVLLKQM